MQDHTPRLARPHDLTPVNPRIAALEDHLARETRSSQALAARVAELEALCTVLGVVPELPADGEPRFLSLADLRAAEVLRAKQVLSYPDVPLLPSPPSVEVRWRWDTFRPVLLGDAEVLFSQWSKRTAFFSALCDAEEACDARKEAP